ncbi:HNH endonuclease signature motif containing protein [Nocardioides sp. CFH 31398]|uniref:HNH endonuclease signature motif containing protein n=1 Tax=Nocardioides sp. CFH 31398 TaxID=2919579 RepID=UPI001F0700C5|nr:HNH endonuclease signature motif containing protein [Nocardioides sp. CFH 31398]MCH1866935.1 HNH endonuclease [Nocardioides sp. CFH 31398]
MTTAAIPLRPRDSLSLAVQVDVLHLVVDDLHATTVRAADAGLLAEVHRAQARLDGLRLKLIAAAQAADVPAGDGQASTADWVAKNTRGTRQDSARDAGLAGSLAGDDDQPALDDTRSALEDGALSASHAKVIADAMRKLPAGLTPAQRQACEARLVDLAGRLDPAQLRRAARRVLEEVEPDPEVVDAHENDQIVEEEDAAHAKARLTFHDNGDGTTSGHFTLPNLAADALRKIIEAMTAPRRTNGRDARQGRAASRESNPFVRDQTDPARDPAHARGLALAQLCEHLPTDHLHGAATTQVTVLMDIETLRGHLRAAGLDTDRPISAGEARRMACNSGIVPTVFGRALDGKPRVLDLGRLSRLFTEAQRAAITALHTHCAARGCTRPVAWCELHHKTPWSHGGTTDLDNAAPLCGWHHRRIHDHRYTHHWHTDGTVSMSLRT